MGEFSRGVFDEPLLEQIELPDGWKVEPLKYHAKMTKGLSIQKTDLVEEGIPVISYGQIHSKKNTTVELKEEFLRFVPRKLAPVHSTSTLKQGDVVFADTSEDVEGIGNAVYNNHAYEVYAGYHTVTCSPKGQTLNGSYFTYLTRTDYWRSQLRKLAMGVKVFSITQSILSRAFVLLPPVDVQRDIAKKLNVLVSQIDAEETLLEKQIDVLERYKKSVIHEAVTKGIHPNVPMKSSGVEWIGDIPEHWETRRIKHVSQTGSGSTPDSSNYDYYDGELSWIQSGDLYGRTHINATERTITSKAMAENQALTIYPAPFVVVAMYGASIGNSALSTIDACTNQACCSLIPGRQLDVHYLLYLLIDAKDDLKAKAIGGTQPNISQVIIKNEKVPLPPLFEQQEIVDYLDEKCVKVDAILDIKSKQIEVLKKRRQSLIYEYVTGKRRIEIGV